MICVSFVFYEKDGGHGQSISFLEYMTSIPEAAFRDLYLELYDHPLPVNKYRNIAGTGRSQTFGVVNRRCLPPDYSRQCWLRPYLFKLLLDFAETYVDISWNAVTVNQDYRAAPHYDKNNVGDSFLVAFGNYTGGELEIHEGPSLGFKDIRHKPIKMDFSKVLHSVRPFEGHRYSLVFYKYDLGTTELPSCSVKKLGDKWRFFRGDQLILPSRGLPHPLQKKILTPAFLKEIIETLHSPAPEE